MSQDKRKFPRVSVEAGIRYRPIPTDSSTVEYLKGVLENVGLGGVFIATEEPLPKGSLVEIEFRIVERGKQCSIRAQALVRWDRRRFTPPGMGLEFIAFEGLGQQQLEVWLLKILDDSWCFRSRSPTNRKWYPNQ